MSGHADQRGLLDWIRAIHGVQKVFVIHGASDSADAFRDKLWYGEGLDAYAPIAVRNLTLLPERSHTMTAGAHCAEAEAERIHL